MSEPTWDEFNVEDEDFTDEEAKEIDEGQKLIPIGLYLCTCISSTPKQIDFRAYSVLGTTLCLNIEKVLEIQKRPPTNDEAYFYVGKKIYDDVAMPHSQEKDAMKKRRKMVALRMRAVIPGETIGREVWQTGVIGKMVIIHMVDGSYTDKTGKYVDKTKVDFFNGYEYAESTKAVTEKVEEWEDI